MSIVVKCAELNPNCEGCQAAKRALEGYEDLVITAKNKVKDQQATITSLELSLGKMRKELDGIKIYIEESGLNDEDSLYGSHLTTLVEQALSTTPLKSIEVLKEVKEVLKFYADNPLWQRNEMTGHRAKSALVLIEGMIG